MEGATNISSSRVYTLTAGVAVVTVLFEHSKFYTNLIYSSSICPIVPPTWLSCILEHDRTALEPSYTCKKVIHSQLQDVFMVF